MGRSDSDRLDGKIALLRISDTHESIAVEDLAARGAVAALIFQQSGPLLVGRVRYPRSSIPCLMIPSALGEALWTKRSGTEPEAHVKLRAEVKTGRGRNIFATPRASESETLFTAHRDSRPFSPGAIDNASGSALLLFLTRNSTRPRFALLSTDAEEYGLLGARSFVKTQRLEKRVGVVNLDSIGSGELHLVERSRAGPLSVSLNSRVASIAGLLDVTLSLLSVPRGSDSDVFMQAGLEACWIRSYPTPTATTTEDTAAYLRSRVLSQCCALLRRLSVSKLSGP